MSAPQAVIQAREQAELLFGRADVVAAIDRLAVRLNVAFADADPLLVCVMKGAVPFTGALMQRLPFALEMDYVHVTRYRDRTIGGELEWRSTTPDVSGRVVLLVDDVLDRGTTLQALLRWGQAAGAVSLSTVVLLDKQVQPRALEPDYAALRGPDRYVFGWGMDYHGYWRNLPDIYALPEGAADAGD